MICRSVLGLLFLFSISYITTAQNPKGIRYIDDVFLEISKTTVQFGRNASLVLDSVNLLMDIYQPVGDTLTKRPSIVLAFGGAFVTGDRSQMADFAKTFTRLGYVAACIDYRIWPIFVRGFPDADAIVDVAAKAMSDMKASIRFLKSEAVKYKLDTNLIFSGGISAGAITAIQCAFVNTNDSIPASLKTVINNNGGLKGNSNNSTLRHTEKVAGVLNLSGAIFDLNLISKDDPPLLSMHGIADATVPYQFGKAAGLVPLYGSGSIHPKLKQHKAIEYLQSVPGGGHTDIYFDSQFAAYLDSFTLKTKQVFYDIINPPQTVPHFDLQIHKVNIFPNPALDHITIQSEAPIAQVHLIDLVGKQIQVSFNGNTVRWSHSISPGAYILHIQFRDRSQTYTKLLIQ